MNIKEATEKALETLEYTAQYGRPPPPEIHRIIDALRTALAEAEEPVAWFESPYGEVRVNPLYKFQFPSSLLSWQIPLYTHPHGPEPLTEEPVAWRYKKDGSDKWHVSAMTPDEVREWNEIVAQEPLYTHPPRREPLTEEEIKAIIDANWDADFSPARFGRYVARAIERAHGIGGDE